MRRIASGALLSVLSLVWLSVPVAAQGVKIGYVDLQLALTESSAGKKAQQAFSAEMNRVETQLEERKEKGRDAQGRPGEEGPVTETRGADRVGPSVSGRNP